MRLIQLFLIKFMSMHLILKMLFSRVFFWLVSYSFRQLLESFRLDDILLF